MAWTHDPQCPVCQELESVDHALYSRRFHSLILDVIDKCWSPVVQGNVLHSARSLPAALSLATPLVVMLWTARAAHWSLRCAVRQHMAYPTFDAFLSTWVTLVDKVTSWEGLSQMAQAFLTFKNALILLRTSAALPTSKINVSKPKPTTPERDKKRRKMANKQCLAKKAKHVLDQLE